MHIFEAQAGVFYGVGVGPGDALLITLKAHYLIQSADVICYLASAKGVPNSATSKRHCRHFTGSRYCSR